jgi:hypothetical protein
MKAFPNALQMKIRYNDTPLSLACLRNVQADVVREIAQATWQRAEYGSLRSSPLLFCNRAGQTPRSIALEEYRRASAHVLTECYRTGVTTSPGDTLPAFDVLATFVKLLHYGPGSESDLPTEFVDGIFVVASLRCPPPTKLYSLGTGV